MDLDRDGRLDLITGSWPGEIYVFPGQEDGSFGARKTLEDKDGETINLGPASAVFAQDWDADGDLDLVVGDIDGHVFLVPNESGGDALELGAATKLTVDDDAIVVPHGDSGPCLADWDGDGTVDLVVGCGDGSVRLFPNQSAEGPPVLSGPVVLLAAPSDGMSLKTGDAIRCGARAKPCVVDWNGDGRLDLLVGDVLSERPPPVTRTATQQAEYDRLQLRMSWIQARRGPASKRVMEKVYEELGVETEGRSHRDIWNGLSKDQQARYGVLYQTVQKRDIEASALARMMQKTWEALRPFQQRSTIHGHVWVLLRASA